MIRIRLYSEDRKLQLLLSSALGKEFQIDLDSTEDGISRLLSAGAADVLVLDLDSNRDSQNTLSMFSRHIASSPVPLVVLADDGMRQAAVELVRQGAYSYCRKPPSIRDLKTVLGQAYESSLLKQRLQVVQQKLHEATSYDQMIGSSSQMRRVYDL